MPHQVSFNEKKIALLGNTQPVLDFPVRSSSANVVLATNLQFAVNNTSTTEELNSDALHGDALVTMTDQYASVDFDSYVPKLGSRYARRYPANETHVLMIDAHLPPGETLTVGVVGSTTPTVTALVTDPNGVSPIQFVEEFLLFITSGIGIQPHITLSGALHNDYTVQQVVGLSEGLAGLLFNAKIEHQNVADIVVGGSAAAVYTTLTKFEGNTYLGSALPIAPFLEASNLYQTIFTGQGLDESLESDLQDVNRYICEILTELKRAWAYVGQAKVWFEEIKKLNPEASALAAAQLAIDNIDMMQRYIGNWINALNMCKGDLRLLQLDYYLNFETQDLNKMLADLAEDMKWATGLTRGTVLQTTGIIVTPITSASWLVDLSGNFAPQDKISIEGRTVENTSLNTHTAAEVAAVFASGVSSTDLILTGSLTPWISSAILSTASNVLNYRAATPSAPPLVTIIPAPASTFEYTVTSDVTSQLSKLWTVHITSPYTTQVSPGSWVSLCGITAQATAVVPLSSLYEALFYELQSNPTNITGVLRTISSPSDRLNWAAGSVTTNTSTGVISVQLTNSIEVPTVPYSEGVQFIGAVSPYIVQIDTDNYASSTPTPKATYGIYLIPAKDYATGTRLSFAGTTLQATSTITVNDWVNAVNYFWAGTGAIPSNVIQLTPFPSVQYKIYPCPTARQGFRTDSDLTFLENSGQIHITSLTPLELSLPLMSFTFPDTTVSNLKTLTPSFELSNVSYEYFTISGQGVLTPGSSVSFNGQIFTNTSSSSYFDIASVIASYYFGNDIAPVVVSGVKVIMDLSIHDHATYRSPSGILPRYIPPLGVSGSLIPVGVKDTNTTTGVLCQKITGDSLIAANTAFTYLGMEFTTTVSLTYAAFLSTLALSFTQNSLHSNFICPAFTAPTNIACAVLQEGSPSVYILITQKNITDTKDFIQIGGDSAWVNSLATLKFKDSGVSLTIPAIALENRTVIRNPAQNIWALEIGGWLPVGGIITTPNAWGAVRTYTNNTGTLLSGSALIDQLQAQSPPWFASRNGNEGLIVNALNTYTVPEPFLTTASSLKTYLNPAGLTSENFLTNTSSTIVYQLDPTNSPLEAGTIVSFPALGLSFKLLTGIPVSALGSLSAILGNGGTAPEATVLSSALPTTVWRSPTLFKLDVTIPVPPSGSLNIIITDIVGSLVATIPPQPAYFSGAWWSSPWYIDFAGTFEAGDTLELLGIKMTILSKMTSSDVASALFVYKTTNISNSSASFMPSINPLVVADNNRTVVELHNSRIVLQALPMTGTPLAPPRIITEGLSIVVKSLTNKSDISALFGSNLDDQDLINPFMVTARTNGMLAVTADPRLQQTMLEYQLKGMGYLVEADKLLQLAYVQTMGNGTGKQNVTQLLKGLLTKVVAKYSSNPTWAGSITYNPTFPAPTPTGWTTGMLVPDLRPCLAKLCFSNTVASPDMMTLEVRRSSVQLIGQQKTAVVKDARALVDLNIEVGKRIMLAFHYEGNLQDTLQMEEVSIPLKRQKTDVADITAAKSIRNASLTDTCGQTSMLGCDCYGQYWNNICLVKASFPNFAGYIRARSLTSCGNIWAYARNSWEFTLEIIQEKADTANPISFNVEDSLGKTFNFNYLQNGTAGETLEVNVTEAVLKDYKDGATQGVVTHVLTFVCTGFSSLCLS